MFSSTQLEAMIRATGGVTVAIGASSTFGHRDIVEEPVLQDGAAVMVTRDTVRVPTGKLVGLANEAAITVDGESLFVGDYRRIEDGAMTLIELVEDLYG